MSASDGATTTAAALARGTRDYRRTLWALFAAGFATFSSMYSVQPLMPVFSERFDISPAMSSLSLSATTGVLAITLFLAGLFSAALPRRPIMIVSITASALLSLAAALAPGWPTLLAVRACEGIALGGVPALALAYLAEEVRPADLATAAGGYIAATAIGGMSGRVLSGVVADLANWRVAFAVIGVTGLIAAGVVAVFLPASRHFTARTDLSLRAHFTPIVSHLRHGALPAVFVCGFVLMGAFVSVYNYVGYRLAAPPFSFSQASVAAVFVVYGLGIGASALAGRLADRVGRAPVLLTGLVVMGLGLGLMWPQTWVGIITGMALLTVGFFMGHSVASGWVGALAEQGKGHAAGLYLLAYYIGSSVIGSAGGLFWSAFGWSGVAGMITLLLVGGFAAAIHLMRWQRRPAP